jgi:hypothetical protein
MFSKPPQRAIASLIDVARSTGVTSWSLLDCSQHRKRSNESLEIAWLERISTSICGLSHHVLTRMHCNETAGIFLSMRLVCQLVVASAEAGPKTRFCGENHSLAMVNSVFLLLGM